LKTWGTHWELDWNTMGDRRKKSLHPQPERKKVVPTRMHVEPFRWPREFYDLK